ncbi:MAG: methyltransferase domain-containing protein [Pirellulales bacterium]
MANRFVHWLKSVVASLYWLSTVGHWGINGVFNALYRGQSQSETFRGIYREVFGPEYPEEVDSTGFLTVSELGRFAQDLHVSPGQKFVDLACGRGGATLWLARQTGASAVGVDIAKVAIADAQRRIAAFGVEGRARFQVGDIADTRFADGAFDAAMSIDALFMVPDKTGTFQEAARILKPGARFAFTTWELDEPQRVKDYRPLLESNGFEIVSYDECAGWLERQRGVHERIIANRDKLIAEMGQQSASVWLSFSQMELPKLKLMKRIYVVARKR